MKITPLLLITFFSLLTSSCKKRGSSVYNEPINRLGPQSSAPPNDCPLQFNLQQNLAEVADMAIEMQVSCRLSENQVLNLAESVFKTP